jgi:hypothetical protein
MRAFARRGLAMTDSRVELWYNTDFDSLGESGAAAGGAGTAMAC